MVSVTGKVGNPLFDSKIGYTIDTDFDDLVEKGTLSKEEAEKEKKIVELRQKIIDADKKGDFDLADKYLLELDKYI